MEKPKEPFMTCNYISCPEFDSKELVKTTYVHPDCIDSYIQDQDEYDDYRENEKLPEGMEEWGYETTIFSLQQLMEMTANLDPKDVTINIQRDRELTSVTVTVEHLTKTDKEAWQAAHDAERAQYKIDHAAYIEADKKYQLWFAEQELEKTIAKIMKLKE